MPFLSGSAVGVVRLRKHGRVLEVLPGGRYRVVVGAMTMVCREDELETISHSKKEQKREREAAAQTAARATADAAADALARASAAATDRLQSIDLHGMTVPEALAALGPFLDRAIRAGLTQVSIIHGISGGKLRAAVRKFLTETPAVTLAAQDEKNPGVTVAYF